MLMLKGRAHFNIIYKLCYKNSYQLIRSISISSGGSGITQDLPGPPLSRIDTESFYLPEPPVVPDIIEPILQYNRLGEATFESLGLNSYWPTGFVQSAFETLHVSLDVPWWGVIVIGAVVTRILMTPLSIKLRKLNANTVQAAPELQKLNKKLKDSMLTYDYLTMARTAQRYQDLAYSDRFKPYMSTFYTFAQLPVFVSVMIALRQMALLPVASLQTGGLFWFTDLTMADPYYILPISTMVMVWIQMEIGADMTSTSQSTSSSTKWGLRCIPVVGSIFTCNFPSALLLYWWCSSALSVLIATSMKITAVKKVLGISNVISIAKTDSGLLNTPTRGFYADWKQSSLEKKVYERAKNVDLIDNEEWIKAGKVPVPKTYLYDPTRRKAA